MSFTKILPSLAALCHSASAEFSAAVTTAGGTAGADTALAERAKTAQLFPGA
ncbi:hypothetical protein G3M48_000133, partial [Beauveria asiatica]